MLFETLFFTGVGGLVLMTLLGFLHGGAHHMARGLGHGHTGLHAGHAAHSGHGAHALHHGVRHGVQGRVNSVQDSTAAPLTTHVTRQVHLSNLLAFIPSPIDIFSMCIGAGLAGMAARMLTYPLPYIVAALGAIAFDFGVVRPMFALLFRCASKPSEGLEGTVALPAEAITKFDERGQGLVLVNMEGQLVQLLAKLEGGDVAGGVVVHKGDRVIVTSVNSQANTCRVTRELSLE